MLSRSLAFLGIAFLGLPFLGTAVGQNEPADRVAGPIVSSVRAKINAVHPLAIAKNDLGRVNSAQVFHRMILLLDGSDAQKADLAQLLSDQQDPSSAQYHKWLSPSEFGQRFGPSNNDLSKVTGWLASQGFTVEKPANGRRFLMFTGTSGQVESAFGTEMHSYKVNGKTYFANAKTASVPAALAGVVKGVARLNGFNPPSALIKSIQPPQALVGGYVFTTPADLQAIYNSKPLNAAGYNGEGQSIALIEQSNINPQDVADFRAITNLPAAKLNIIVNGPDPGLIGDETEAIVDVDYAGAFAPNATLNFIVSASTEFNSGIDLSTVYAVDYAVSRITSLSYGGCETVNNTFGDSSALYAAAWEQGAAEGISHFVSSGDNGGDSCGYTGLNTGFGVNALGSSPYNVSVGGTEFNTPTLSTYFPPPTYIATGYIPETAWNDYENPADGRALAGGGGVSINFAKPYWQQGPGVPSDGYRDLPDVSLLAGDNLAYLLCERDIGANCAQGIASGEIGTSLAAPSWASIQALVNQKNNLLSGAGNPNPSYYALAAGSSSPFHDITVGDTKVPDPDGQLVGYNTTVGYDLATGLGSVDVNKLATSWTAPTGSGSATVQLTTNGTSIMHGSKLTAVATVSASGATTPTGDLVFLAGTEGVEQTTLSAGSSSFTFGPASGVVLPGGAYAFKAHYAGDAKFAPADSNAISLTVSAEPTSTLAGASPTSGIYGQPITIGALTYGLNSNTGNVVGGTYTFKENGKSLGTATVPFTGESFNSLSYNFEASILFQGPTPLSVGTHTITVSSPPSSASFAASTSGTVTVTITKAPVLASLAVDHTTPAVGSAINLTANVIADYGGLVPVTGNVDFYDGKSKIGTVALGGTPDSLGDFFATYKVAAVAAGLHTYTAIYNGDGNNLANQTGSLNVTAGKSTTVTSLVSNTLDTLVLVGTSVTLQANVTGDSAGVTPTGTVTFTDTNSATPVVVGTATITGTTATLKTTSLAAGRHNIIATYAGDTNFGGSLSGATIVRVADFTLTANPTSVTVVAGQTTSPVTLSYSSNYDISQYGGNPTVTLACSGLPTGSACNFTSAALTPAANASGAVVASSTLTISTTGLTVTKASLGGSGGFTIWFAFGLGGVLLIGLPVVLRRRRLVPAILGLTLLVAMGGLNGCSGYSGPRGGYNVASSGTPAGSYTVTVTATVNGGTAVGTLAHTSTVALSVTSAGN